MTQPKKQLQELEETFKKEDLLRKQIQDSLEQSKKDGLNAPDLLEKLKRQSPNKKVALPDADPSV